MTRPRLVSFSPSPSAHPNRQRGRIRWGWLIALAILAALGGGYYYVWKSRAPAAEAGAGPGGPGGPGGTGGPRRFGAGSQSLPVSAGTIRQQDVRVLVPAIGNIAALNTAVVRARVDGELRALHFKEGQQVRAGQLLAEIDPRSFEVALAQAQGQLARDQAQLRNAQLDLERYKDLLAKDSIAKQQVDTQEALVRQLQGTVQADQASVDSARLQLSYTRVTAPISGRLGLKQADLGNIVRSSDTNGLVSITQVQPIAVVFAVPEAHLPRIQRKLRAGEPLVVEAWDRDMKSRLATGRVSTTDNAIDTVTGTIKLKAEFANADGSLFPNQFVNIRLQVDTLKDVTAVPVPAVQRGAQGTFVYVVTPEGTVTVRRVRLGATEGDWVSVEGDVQPGDRVVTDGADRLREGARVEIIAPAARGGAGGRADRNGAAAPAGSASAPAGAASAPAAVGGLPAGASAAAGATGATAAARAARGTGETAASPARAAEAGSGANTAAAVGADARAGAGEAGDRPRWMDRLPPEVVEKVKAMSPEERRAFFQKMRERRQREQGN